MNRLRLWLRKWLGIDKLEDRLHRAELIADGFDPDDPYLLFKLQMRAMDSDPRYQVRLTNIQAP